MAQLAYAEPRLGSPDAEWLVEIDLDAVWRPELPQLLSFRDSVWAAGASIRPAGSGWTVAVIVNAGGPGEATQRAAEVTRGLDCPFGLVRQMEASPVE